MDLVLFPKLSTRSRRALKRIRGKFGRHYEYNPRPRLIQRLTRETGWTKEQVWEQLFREREYLIKDLW
jgi:hypothetical protein